MPSLLDLKLQLPHTTNTTRNISRPYLIQEDLPPPTCVHPSPSPRSPRPPPKALGSGYRANPATGSRRATTVLVVSALFLAGALPPLPALSRPRWRFSPPLALSPASWRLPPPPGASPSLRRFSCPLALLPHSGASPSTPALPLSLSASPRLCVITTLVTHMKQLAVVIMSKI